MGIVEDMRNLREDIVVSRLSRVEVVNGIRKDARTIVKEDKEYVSGIKKGVSDLRKEHREHISGIKKEVADLISGSTTIRKEMHEAWQKIKPIVEAKVEAPVEEIEVEEPELGELKEKVLEIITSCPHGISLTGIGLQLGVEWRKLIRPAKELLNEGKIRKEDVNYFPVAG